MSWIGRSIRRFEDPTPLPGRGRYTVDIAAMSSATAAVINAVVDALRPLGVDIFEMPVSPRRPREPVRRAPEAKS